MSAQPLTLTPTHPTPIRPTPLHPTPLHPTPLRPTPADMPALAIPSARVAAPEPAGRTLHLINIENLVAGQVAEANLATAWRAYQRRFPINDGDQVRIACSSATAALVGFTIPTGRQLLIGANTRNGADHALIDSVDVAFTADRFEQVILASGGHIFAPLAAALAGAGCPVTVTYLTYLHCAKALQLAATTCQSMSYRLNRRDRHPATRSPPGRRR